MNALKQGNSALAMQLKTWGACRQRPFNAS